MPIQANKIIQTHNMATAAQKKNIARFKAVQAEAKKLKSKNKSLSHIQAVKQAWTILYSKEKKSPSKTTKKRKVGALPIGFTGNILNVPFKVVNQFDIYDEVNAIVENTNTGKKIITIDGKTSTKDLTDKFFAHIKMNVDYEKGDIPKDTLQRISKFVIGLSKEVKDYNAGKKQTIKKQPLIIAAKKSPSPKKSKVVKIKKTATKKSSSSGSKKLTYVGVRKLESGASRYEYKLAGIGTVNNNLIEKYKQLDAEILRYNKIYTDYVIAKRRMNTLKNRAGVIQYNKDIKRISDYLKELKTHKAELKKLL